MDREIVYTMGEILIYFLWYSVSFFVLGAWVYFVGTLFR